MKLLIDLSALQDAVSRMGPSVDIDPFALQPGNDVLISKSTVVDTSPPPEFLIPEGGLELTDLDEISTSGNLLSWQGQQVLLYIQDHRSRFSLVRQDGAEGNKVHIALCQKLEEMKSSGRFERYVITRDHSEQFRITGRSFYGKEESAVTNLKVCKLCLNKINYNGYASPGNKEIFEVFSFVDFFQKHESFFPYHPERKSGVSENYTTDWPEVSRNYREKRQYKCEKCRLELTRRPHLLHTHHINGVRGDNREQNLSALCIDCHSKEPYHQHMTVPHKSRQEIAHLRREQRVLIISDWKDVFKLADPGLTGVLHYLKNNKVKLPEVGFDVKDENGVVIANLELAWPHVKVSISISKENARLAKTQKWRVYSVESALNFPLKLVELLKK